MDTADHAPAAPPPVYVAPPPTGRQSWALGFLAWIPIPLVGPIIAAVAMISVYPSVKRKQVPAATENARRAANWGLTVLTVTAACAIYIVAVLAARPEFFPFGLLAFFALCIVHAVLTIAGTVIAGKRVFRVWCAIPYLR